MAEFILPLAKSILAKLGGDIATSYVTDEIKAAMSAKDDLEIIKDKFTAICAVLEDAEEQQYANKAMQLWLKDLKSVAYDIDDLLDELAYDALLRSVNKGHFWRQTRYYLSTSNPVLSRFDLGRKIKSLREQLVHIVSKKNDFNLTDRPVGIPKVQRNALDSCDYVNKLAVVGRNEAKEDVIKKLVSLDDDSALGVLPIIGMGGIGKTTLAKLVYHDVTGFDIKLWACVSDEFEIQKILSKIIENHSDYNTSNMSLGRLTLKLKELLNGKKYFLVLDDVWVDNVTKWIDLKNVLEIGNPGSVILITTRNTQVANITRTIDPYNLDRLPDDVCWSIFEQLAFIKGDEHKFPKLFEIGRCIVQKCRGVPLVVKTLGSLLRIERSEVKWLEIKNMDNFSELHGEYDHVMQLLKLSYVRLPTHLKPFFAYLALVLKDTIYGVAHHAYKMMALGLSDTEPRSCAQNYCAELLSKSMIQETTMGFTGKIIKFKVHDMLHDVAVAELGEELGLVTENEFNVSESARYVYWKQSERSSTLPDKYHEKLFRARKTRTFVVPSFGNRVTQSFLEKIIFNFNRLRILEMQNSFIDELPSSIGGLKHLRLLNLSGNPIKSLPDTICELLNLQTLYLEDCEQLEELPKRLHRWINMTCLSVTTRQKSFAGTQLNELQSLQDLYIISCKRLTSLWECNNSVGRMASLRVLFLQNCPSLTSLPSSMKLLVTLEELKIKNCQELDLEDGDALSGLLNLGSLTIMEMPHMTRLPNAIQSAATSLQYLWISECGGLLELPMWLPSFTSLKELCIRDCLHLSNRCAISVGEDYPLIRHVPIIWLDGGHFSKQQQ